MSCAGSSLWKTVAGVEDLFGRLGPFDGAQVVIRGINPGAGCGFGDLDGSVAGALAHVGCAMGAEASGLVDHDGDQDIQLSQDSLPAA